MKCFLLPVWDQKRRRDFRQELQTEFQTGEINCENLLNNGKISHKKVLIYGLLGK
jgi:hypothetical protein